MPCRRNHCHRSARSSRPPGCRPAESCPARILSGMDDDRVRPDRPAPRPARPVGVDLTRRAARSGPPYPHDRHDRGRAGARGTRILARHEPVGSGAAELARVIRRTIARRRPGRRHRLRDVRARRARRRRDPARGRARGRVRAPGHATRHEPVAAQAFELSLDPPATGLVIGISHEGGDDRDERGARRPPGRPVRARRSSP